LPSPHHALLVWPDINSVPRKMMGPDLRSEFNGFVWKVPEPGPVAVLAVTYQGACLGTYWNSAMISASFLRPPSAKTFSLIRWLKIPILNSTFKHSLQQAVSRAPAEFVRGWLSNGALPAGLLPRAAEQGLDTVVRAFLWNHVEYNEARMRELVQAFPRLASEAVGQAEQFKQAVMRMGEICPSLAYNLARLRLRGQKGPEYWRHIHAAVASVLGLSSTSLSLIEGALNALGRDCANLIGITPEQLRAAVDSLRNHLDGRASDEPHSSDLRRLGERMRGRQYLTAALLLRLLEGIPVVIHG